MPAVVRTHQIASGSKYESQGCTLVTSGRAEGSHQENMFPVQLAAGIDFHKPTD